MKIQQLQRIFRYIPKNIIDNLKGIDFKTCWYGSAGLDKRPLELLDSSHPDALINEKVQVFFYTDIDYAYFNGKLHLCNNPVDFENGHFPPYDFQGIKSGEMEQYPLEFQKRHLDFINGNAIIYRHQNKFDSKYFNANMIRNHQTKNLKKADEILKSSDARTYNKLRLDLSAQIGYVLSHGEISFEDFCQHYQFFTALVIHKAIDGSDIYCFYTDCDDWTFERLLIKEKVKINYIANKGGYTGPAAEFLANLNAEYLLGYANPNNEETDFESKPYTTEIIRTFVWSHLDQLPFDFSKVVY